MEYLVLIAFATFGLLPLILFVKYLNKKCPQWFHNGNGYVYSKSDTIVFNPTTWVSTHE